MPEDKLKIEALTDNAIRAATAKGSPIKLTDGKGFYLHIVTNQTMGETIMFEVIEQEHGVHGGSRASFAAWGSKHSRKRLLTIWPLTVAT